MNEIEFTFGQKLTLAKILRFLNKNPELAYNGYGFGDLYQSHQSWFLHTNTWVKSKNIDDLSYYYSMVNSSYNKTEIPILNNMYKLYGDKIKKRVSK